MLRTLLGKFSDNPVEKLRIEIAIRNASSKLVKSSGAVAVDSVETECIMETLGNRGLELFVETFEETAHDFSYKVNYQSFFKTNLAHHIRKECQVGSLASSSAWFRNGDGYGCPRGKAGLECNVSGL